MPSGDHAGWPSFVLLLVKRQLFNPSASITGIVSGATENHSNTQAGSNLQFLTTNNGTILGTEKMTENNRAIKKQ